MKVVCFDLDDTLYKEIEYLREAYRIIAQSIWGKQWLPWYEKMLKWYDDGDNVFNRICELCPDIEKDNLLSMYRYDVHQLILSDEVRYVLDSMLSGGVALGLITDGRTQTQRNKIVALGLEKYFLDDMIVISESFGTDKSDERNFRYFMDKYPECSDFVYVADNPRKDFIAPNRLGWTTICLLDDGRNIHNQIFNLPEYFLPKLSIKSLSEICH